MIIRNDDVAFDTTLAEIRHFCSFCDQYGFQPLHAITPIGAVRHVRAEWDNERIRRETGNRLFLDNEPVLEYLRGRRTTDLFAVHGLWHTHTIPALEVEAAVTLLGLARFDVTFQVPPFNEYQLPLPGLRFSGKECPRLEEYLNEPERLPPTDIAYVHSWRFEYGPFTWRALESCLKKLSTLRSSNAAPAVLQTGVLTT